LDLRAQIETHIISHLIHDDQYCRRVIPYLEPAYFDQTHRLVLKLIGKFMAAYNKPPTSEVLKLELMKENASDEILNNAAQLISILDNKTNVESDYLIKETESWCREKAIHNAILESFNIIQGKSDDKNDGAIPELLSNALGVNFNQSIGHDYFLDYQSRFEAYNVEEHRIPFSLDYFNKITNGGMPRKTLNIILAGTGTGKSLFMCNEAAFAIGEGYNVLYITMEMSEQKIAERIDANLMDIPINTINTVPENVYSNKIKSLMKNTLGKLIIKEYPTGGAHAGHFRALINELKLKKNFTPDIIFIDYLNICSSSRMKTMGGSINSYTYIKAIAEELRGLGVEFDVPIVSATQVTRSAYSSTDIGLEDTSESFGLPATADLMVALINTDEMEELNQILVKQLKNRYNDLNTHKRFIVGIDRKKMRLYDAEESAQTDIMSDMKTPKTAFDSSEFKV
jgi:replicative DNA helicase